MKWFQGSSPQITHQTSPVNWPAGLFVEAEDGVWYIIAPGKRVRVFSDRVLNSWSATPLYGTEASLKNHTQLVGPLGFRNGTLIKNIVSGRYYLISENKRRLIANPDIFTNFNLSSDTAIIVSDEEANLHPEGEVLS